MYRKSNALKEKFKKEKKRSSTNSLLVVPPANKTHFQPVKTAPTLQNRPCQCSRESSVAFSLFKKQFIKETALNSPSIKECRKELLRRWSLLPEVKKNVFTLSSQSIAFVKKLTKKIIFSWLVVICVSSGIIQSV